MATPTSQVVFALRQEGFPVRTHADWGARYESVYQDRRQDMPVRLPVRYAFGHITVTYDDGTLTGDFDRDMRELERIGYERFGSGISYNFTVDKDTGMIGIGQYIDAKGTHTVNNKGVLGYPYNLNLYGIAIAWIGVPGQTLSAKAIISYAAIIRIMKRLNFMMDTAYLLPHSLFAAKDCPTDALRVRIPDIMRLAGLIPATGDLELTVGQYETLMKEILENRRFLVSLSKYTVNVNKNLASFMQREYAEDAAEQAQAAELEALIREHSG